jgi:DNA-binding transcriptional MocR family regulator
MAGTISLARGWPAPECLPVAELADCARSAMERDGATILSYGPSPGYGPLREWAAERHGVDPSQVFFTNGSLQGFVFLAQRLAPGRRVLVERPTYDRPLKILSALGAEIVPVDCDDEGLDPDALEAALGRGEPPAFLYVIPTFQNPSGRTLGLERRRRVVELAAQHDLLVLEDDPYGLVRFEGEPLPSLHELSGGATAYSSSFSKTIAPGLRVGWFVLPDPVARDLEGPRPGRTSHPSCSARRRSTSSCGAACSSRTWSASEGSSAPGGTRCSRRLRASSRTPAPPTPRAATSCGRS